ncbi:MAG: DNA repair protein RecO [Acidobacteriota bacterium]
MALYRAEALLVEIRDLHERDRIVGFLSAEHGLRRGVAKGARAKYSRYAGQLQPLAKIDVRWFQAEGRDLGRLSDVALLRAPRGLGDDLEGLLLTAYLADLMATFAQAHEPAPRLYRLLDTTLDALADGVERALAVRYVEIWTLRLEGVFPAPIECPLCGHRFAEGEVAYLAPEDDALICADCARAATAGWEGGPLDGLLQVSAEALDVLRRSARASLTQLAAAPPPARVVREIERLCARVRRAFLQDELRSYRVLHQTLGSL